MQLLVYKCDRCGMITEDSTVLEEITLLRSTFDGSSFYAPKKVSLCPCCMGEKNQLDEKFMRREQM